MTAESDNASTETLPLEGLRILAVEQMQAMPFGTQLLARMGADVVKVEHPKHGESGRGSLPSIQDSDGSQQGSTFLRNNLAKRSLGLDLKKTPNRSASNLLAPAAAISNAQHLIPRWRGKSDFRWLQLKTLPTNTPITSLILLAFKASSVMSPTVSTSSLLLNVE